MREVRAGCGRRRRARRAWPWRSSSTGWPSTSPRSWSRSVASMRSSSPAGSARTTAVDSGEDPCQLGISRARGRPGRQRRRMAAIPMAGSPWRRPHTGRAGRADRRGTHDRARCAEADVMTRTLLVVPTGPSVGLTSACLGLLRALDERGVRVGYLKPLAQPRVDEREEGSTALVAGLTAADSARAGAGRSGRGAAVDRRRRCRPRRGDRPLAVGHR